MPVHLESEVKKNVEPSEFGFEAYTPTQIARRVEEAAVAKVAQPGGQTFTLGILAGAFIAFGAIFYTLVLTNSGLGFGPSRFVGGIAFSLGLVLVVVGGGELFTGNNLIVMAWADRKISGLQLLRNWVIVYLGNLVGALGTAILVVLSGVLNLADGMVGETANSIAAAKLELTFMEAFFRGILCNVLVCLSVWLCFSARSVTDKIVAILLPISAFVGLGFEHSVANMYTIPVAMMAEGIEWQIGGFLRNLGVVTAGNIVGGGGFVALVYWLVYSPNRSKTNNLTDRSP